MSEQPRTPAEQILGLDARALLGRVMRPPAEESAMRLGDYELIRRVAQGGMGVIYVARQISLHRIVALKMIRSGLLATPEEVTRFRREAEAAASLDHPHIVPIYQIGEEEGQHFFSMKLLEGGNLAELSAACTAPDRSSTAWVRRAAGIVSRLARAVHHAHQRGLLHRDIKPTNVLLDEHGEPHLTDFGLAKMVERNRDLTLTLAVMGTPGYMAPEQAAGNSKELTIAADIYSLGAVLYELLTGRPPFEGETTLDLLRQVQESEPQALRKSNPGLNRDLETICLKCLQKEPERRYATAEELAADMDRWHAGKPILARPVSPLVRFWLWSRRNPVAAMAGVLLLVLAAVATMAAARLRSQRNEINEALQGSLLAQAQAQHLSTVPGRRGQSLEALATAARIRPSLALRNEAIAALALTDLAPPQVWRRQDKMENYLPEVFLTADGARYAILDRNGGITVHNRQDGAVLTTLITPPNTILLRGFSPDGNYLMAYDGARNVFVWDVRPREDGHHTHLYMLQGPWGLAAEFTPDSRSLALARHDRTVRFHDLKTGVEHLKLEFPFDAFYISTAPAGDLIALTSGNTLYVWRINPAAQLVSHRHQSVISAIEWHPDGRIIAVGYENGEMQMYDIGGSGPRWLTPHGKYVDNLTFDPRGEFLASSSFDSTHRYSDPATGRLLLETRESGKVQATRGGRYVAIRHSDRSLGAREILRSPVLRTLTSARTGFLNWSGVDISPDGRWLVSGTSAGLHLWSVENGVEAAFSASALASRPRFHPDGEFIVSGGGTELLRWPVVLTSEGSGVRAGPPEVLTTVPNVGYSPYFSPDGTHFAVGGRGDSRIVNWKDPSQVLYFGHHEASAGHDHVVLSPDGNWVAGASFGGVGVTVWNAHDGTMLQHLIKVENADLAISPDGHTLATATARELVLWDTTTWQPRRRVATGLTGGVPVPVVFSHDGTLIAAALTRQEIQLLDARTVVPLATLTPPLPASLVALAFSADGRHLAGQAEGPAIQLWDLHALRRELRVLGLDWK